jgi:hypothetical protein
MVSKLKLKFMNMETITAKLPFFGLLICLCLIPLRGISQSNILKERSSYTLRIAVDSIEFYETEVKAGSYILPDKTLQLYTGETVFIEVETRGKEIVSLRTVKENKKPQKTVAISFLQLAMGHSHKMMELKISNPFYWALHYKAGIFLIKPKKWIPTDVLPIPATLESFETWPDPIATIALSDWKLQE